MTLQRRDIVGSAVHTTLASGIDSVVTSIPIVDSSGWQDGASGPWGVIIDPGLANEEKALILSRSGTTLTVVTAPSSGRGHDGSSGSSHTAGAVIYPIMMAEDLDDMNSHIYDTVRDDHTQYLTNTRHDTITRHGDTTLGIPSAPADIGTSAAVGTASTPRAYQDHVHKIGTAAINSSSMLANGVVGNTQLAANSVASANIVDGTIVTADLADNSITSAKIVDATIVTADLADSSVTSAKIVDATVTGTDIAASTVARANLAADAQKSVDVAWGQIATGVSTTDQTTAGSITTILGATLTFTAVANRRYRTTLYVPRIQATVTSTNGEVQVNITDGSNVEVASGLNRPIWCEFLEQGEPASAYVVLEESNLSAGSYTRRARFSSTGSQVEVFGATWKAVITTEDIGPA